MSGHVGKFAYAAAFIVLWRWSMELDRSSFVTWPTPLAMPVAAPALALGAILMAAAMWALWIHGGGLPMNVFPPQRLVERSAYRLFAHPIYVGHAVSVFALAALAHSPAGFWIVAPVATLATAALVLGYEGRAVHARFGPRRVRALLALPPDDEAVASFTTKCIAMLLAWGPWAVAYAAFSQAPAAASADELRFAFELEWPRSDWWVWPYTAAYPFVVLCPLALGANREVRRFIVGIWIASAAGFAMMLTWPGKAAMLPPTDGGGGMLLQFNRALDADWLACPSFHVAWSVLAALIYARRWPHVRAPAYAIALVISSMRPPSGSRSRPAQFRPWR